MERLTLSLLLIVTAIHYGNTLPSDTEKRLSAASLENMYRKMFSHDLTDERKRALSGAVWGLSSLPHDTPRKRSDHTPNVEFVLHALKNFLNKQRYPDGGLSKSHLFRAGKIWNEKSAGNDIYIV